MKYRASPFQALSLILFGLAVYYFIEISNSQSDPGLGGLIPFILLGLAFGTIALDFISQLFFQRRRKWFYIFQFSVLAVGAIWMMQASGARTLVITEKRPQYIRIIYGVPNKAKLPGILGFSSKTRVPQTGTLLTSTNLKSDSRSFDFEWVDGTAIGDNWALIPVKLTGKYPCDNHRGSIGFRLFYLSNTRIWARGKDWNEVLDIDLPTENQLRDLCR